MATGSLFPLKPVVPRMRQGRR